MRRPHRTMAAVFVLALIFAAVLSASQRIPSASGNLRLVGPVTSLAATVALGWSGIDPVAISLNWTQSNDTCFISYTLEASSSGPNGPWRTVWNTTQIADNSTVAYNLPGGGPSPGSTYWWRLIDRDCGGSSVSNVLRVTQPWNANLTYAFLNATTVRLSWTNHAVYGGYLRLSNYTVNLAPWFPRVIITDPRERNYTVTGLSQPANYLFYIGTIDLGNASYYPGPIFGLVSNAVSIRIPPPLAAAVRASSTSADVGQVVTFTCSPTGGWPPYFTQWTFGDGWVGYGSRVNHTYNAVGTMTATCTVADALGTATTNDTDVTVSSRPQVLIAASRLSLDTGQVIRFVATSAGGSGEYSYVWTGLPTGCNSVDTGRLDCTPQVGGLFTVTVTVTDSNGGSASASSSLVIVSRGPSASLAATPTSFVLGNTVTFQATVFAGSGGNVYRWENLPPGCGASSDSTGFTCAPSSAGVYNVTFTVTDSNGGTAEASALITVEAGLLGVPSVLGYGLAVGLGVLVIGAIAVLLVRRRRGTTPPLPVTPRSPPPPAR